MSDESLGRNEVEELLRSMEAGDKKKPAPTPAAAAKDFGSDMAESKADALLSKKSGPRQRVVAYDFKRPERVGKEQMRALQSLHEVSLEISGASMSRCSARLSKSN